MAPFLHGKLTWPCLLLAVIVVSLPGHIIYFTTVSTVNDAGGTERLIILFLILAPVKG